MGVPILLFFKIYLFILFIYLFIILFVDAGRLATQALIPVPQEIHLYTLQGMLRLLSPGRKFVSLTSVCGAL